MALLGSGEDTDCALVVGVDIGQQPLDMRFEFGTPLLGNEAGEHDKAIAVPGFELFGVEHVLSTLAVWLPVGGRHPKSLAEEDEYQQHDHVSVYSFSDYASLCPNSFCVFLS